MTYLFETEEEEARSKRSGKQARGSRDAEITLGTRSLLGIFFGLVLICGIFFGLGYSVGRVGSSRAAVPTPAETPGAVPDTHLQKPSADQQSLTPAPTPAPSEDASIGAPAQDSPDTSPQTAGNPAPNPAAATPAPTFAPAALTQPAATSGTFMVQVAAVRVAQDADILVAALKKHGYNAVVRNEPQDQLLHVQLGPYSVRTDAIAMRAKLLADGYNAVLK